MVTIESDSQQADNVTGIVTATGNVRITYPEQGMVATSRQAQYFSKEGKLVLTGDVDVIDREGQRIRAERLTYRLENERIVAEPQPGRQVTSRLKIRQQPDRPPQAQPVLP
jgi:lipopolysaccharide export system protein LptA